MYKSLFGVITALTLGAASTGSAATLQLNGSVSVSGGGGFVQDFTFDTEETLFLSDTLMAASNASPSAGSASSLSQASIDAQTGQMRFSLTGQREALSGNCSISGCGANFAASSLTRIVEDVTLSGTGTLTMFMQVDAFWSAPGYDFNAFTAVFGSGGTTDVGNGNINLNSANSDATSATGLLTSTISYDSEAERDFTLTWGIQGLINSGNSASLNESGFLDASNTATIFFEATDGLIVSGVTDGFLSNAAFLNDTDVAPVPLPTSLTLLLAALSGIFFFRGKSSNILASRSFKIT